MPTTVSAFTYPEEFVKRVKEEFPDWDELHKLLDANDEFAGRLLDDNSNGKIEPEDVVQAISQNDAEGLQKLKDEAEKIILRKGLYAEWLRIYRAWKGW
jgi:hypothetical protein